MGHNARAISGQLRCDALDDDLARARAESAALLNLDPDKLSPTDALKCELVSALRLVVDDELARATSGNGADLGKLIVAVCRGRTPDRAHARCEVRGARGRGGGP